MRGLMALPSVSPPMTWPRACYRILGSANRFPQTRSAVNRIANEGAIALKT
jgi:hypothetical protein